MLGFAVIALRRCNPLPDGHYHGLHIGISGDHGLCLFQAHLRGFNAWYLLQRLFHRAHAMHAGHAIDFNVVLIVVTSVKLCGNSYGGNAALEPSDLLDASASLRFVKCCGT